MIYFCTVRVGLLYSGRGLPLQNINRRDNGLFDFGLELAFAGIRKNTLFCLMSLIGQIWDGLTPFRDFVRNNIRDIYIAVEDKAEQECEEVAA